MTRTLFWAPCLLLAGCMVGPRYQAPNEAPVMTRRATPDIVSAAAPDPAWWRSFNDPVLDQLLDKALTKNLDLALAATRVREARALFLQSTLDLFPHVTAEGAYFRGDEQIPGLTANRVRREQADIGFDAAWEIDLFGRVRHQVRAAQAEEAASAEDLAAARVSVAAEVVRNYLALRGAQQLQAVVRENVAAVRETVRITSARVEAGGANPIDLESAKTQLSTELSRLPDLDTEAAQASARLAVLCGERPGSFDTQLLAAATAITPRRTPLPIGDVGALLQHRPDVQAAERRLAAETERTGSATADLFPRFNVTGFIGFLSGDVSNLFGKSGKAWQVTPGVTWPAFDIGSAEARLRAQRARQAGALATYQQTVLVAIEELQNALIAYHNRQDQLLALLDGVQSASRQLDLATIQYREGSIDYLRLLNATRDKLGAQEALTRAQTSANTDVVAIYKALGGVGQAGVPTPTAALP